MKRIALLVSLVAASHTPAFAQDAQGRLPFVCVNDDGVTRCVPLQPLPIGGPPRTSSTLPLPPQPEIDLEEHFPSPEPFRIPVVQPPAPITFPAASATAKAIQQPPARDYQQQANQQRQQNYAAGHAVGTALGNGIAAALNKRREKKHLEQLQYFQSLSPAEQQELYDGACRLKGKKPGSTVGMAGTETRMCYLGDDGQMYATLGPFYPSVATQQQIDEIAALDRELTARKARLYDNMEELRLALEHDLVDIKARFHGDFLQQAIASHNQLKEVLSDSWNTVKDEYCRGEFMRGAKYIDLDGQEQHCK